MSELVRLTKQGNIAIITIDNPPVNALSPGVPEGIASAIEQIGRDDNVVAAVMIGVGRTFVAGADIKEFGKMTSGKTARGDGFKRILLQVEDCRKPVVMAIHGTAFGGGLELAMAGRYRVAAPSAQVGQPEVKLGIIPGAAGTQRLPRLAGVAGATGRTRKDVRRIQPATGSSGRLTCHEMNPFGCAAFIEADVMIHPRFFRFSQDAAAGPTLLNLR
jgi:3-hydroxyacyl-CoA dehydrogenase